MTLSDKPLSPSEKRFQALLQSLPEHLRLQISGKSKLVIEDQEHKQFQELCRTLPAPLREAVQAASNSAAPEWPAGCTPQEILIVMEDGEPPRVHICRDARVQAEVVGHNDGNDTYVFAVYGILKHITRQPHRMVVQPDNSAIEAHAPYRRIEDTDFEVEIQDDGFLGPPELLGETKLREFDRARRRDVKVTTVTARPIPPPYPDDGSDDEDRDERDEHDDESGTPVKT